MRTVLIGISCWVLACFLGACSTVPVHELSLCGSPPTTEEAQQAVEGAVSSMGLKDPYSAQVENIRIVEPYRHYRGVFKGGYDYGWLITFALNAKNSYGAYVGFRTYQIMRTEGGAVWFVF